jgi:hypothetical protein
MWEVNSNPADSVSVKSEFYLLRNDVRFKNGHAYLKYGSVTDIALLVVIWIYIFYRNCAVHY